MPKVIPAVFFQKQLDGFKADAKKPERLELFESELLEVAGGLSQVRQATGSRLTIDGPDGSGGHTTFSGSAGWADVMQADDCAA
jgi:hypothetical protein